MCDTVVRVEPGRVLFAKNSDRDANEAQLLEWHGSTDHRDGARLRCTHIVIPQARRTHAILISRPFWTWGAEMGTNEHGLVIGNEAVFTREPYAKRGLTGMDILRLALERAASAEDGVEVIKNFIENVGQGGGCGLEDRDFTYHNSYIVADTLGAFVVETAGHHVAVERVHGSRSISNGLTIPWFRRRHEDRLITLAAGSNKRRACTQKLVRNAAGPVDMARILRRHRDNSATPHYSWFRGGLAAPCMHGGGLVANSQTVGSWVSALSPNRTRHWATGTAAPCTGLFKPVSVDNPLDTGAVPTAQADPHSLWWRHERLHRRLLRGSDSALFARYRAERDAIEAEHFAGHVADSEGFARASALLERYSEQLDFEPPPDTRPPWARRYWRKRARAAKLDFQQV